MAELDKNIRVVSAPDSAPDWPTPPEYVSPVSFHDLGALSVYLADPPGRWMEFSNVLSIVKTFDQALSKERFENWQLRGLL